MNQEVVEMAQLLSSLNRVTDDVGEVTWYDNEFPVAMYTPEVNGLVVSGALTFDVYDLWFFNDNALYLLENG